MGEEVQKGGTEEMNPLYGALLEHTPLKGPKRPREELVKVMEEVLPGVSPEKHLAVCYTGALLGLLIFLVYAVAITFPSPIVPDRNGDGVGDPLEDVEETYVVKVVDGEVTYFFTGYTGRVSPAKVVLLLGFPLLILPSTLYTLLYYYPFHLARKRRLQVLYDVPVAVGAMAISLQANPSLSEAVELAGSVTGEGLSRELKGLHMRASTGAAESLEEEVRRLAERVGEGVPQFKEALLKIVSASLERGEESIRRESEMAVSEAHEGLRISMRRYAHSLRTPTLILFSLGVMLPLMLVAILPLTGSGVEELPKTVLFFNVALPLATALYGTTILSRRPPFSRPLQEEVCWGRRPLLYPLVLFVLLLAALILQKHLLGVAPLYLSMQAVVGVSLTVSLAGAVRYLPGREEARRCLELEKELPEALYYIGSSMSEGKSFERALRRAHDHMKAPAVQKLLKDALSRLTRQKVSLKEAFLGDDGVLEDYPSPLTRSSMMITVYAVERNPEATGRLLMAYSSFLKGLKRIKEEMLEELSSTVGMMEATAVLFAPLILGITVSMYGAFAENMVGLGGVPTGGLGSLATYTPIPEASFLLIAGAYLIFISTFLSYFTGQVRSREEGVLRFRPIFRNPLISSVIFVLSFLLTRTFF